MRRRSLLAGLWLVAAFACGVPPEPAPQQPWEQGTGGEAGDAAEAPPEPVAEPTEPAPAPATGPHAEYADREPVRTLRGRASYYADSLAGNTTASGDAYDPSAHTAASRELPFGTIVRITRVDNGASTLVRVNDRGPFRDHSRILDLSRAAAEDLDMIRAGVVDIRADILHEP